MQNNYKIFVLGTTSQTIKLISGISEKFEVSGVLTMNGKLSYPTISGYQSLRNNLKNLKIPIYEVDDYTLKAEKDVIMISKLQIDILIVLGWQRLVPDWLINHVNLAVVGIHGSPDGITKGRGRSPQNWAKIIDAKFFLFSLFIITPEIDDGKILISDEFEIESDDDISSLYDKLTQKVIHLCLTFLSFPISHIENAKPQQGEPRYFPKRIPSDGAIDWFASSQTIIRYVKALTKPYPGAFTLVKSNIIHIWKVEQVEINSAFSEVTPGTILEIHSNEEIVVKTADGALLVKEFANDSNVKLKVGIIFKSIAECETLKNIIQRHYQKYPDKLLNQKLLDYKEKVCNEI